MKRIISGRRAIFKLSLVGSLALGFLGISLMGVREEVSASAFGPSPTHTNAPGEANCTSCHADFKLNEGEGRVLIQGVSANYSPGQQMNIVVRAEQENAVIYGFQLTAIDSTGQKVGTFTIPLTSENRIQILQGVVGPQNLLREYVEHTSGGLSNGQFGFNTWEFSWTAPMQSVGRVDFYATANAANSDGGTGGDYIYATTASTAPPSTPVTLGGRVTTPSGQPLRNAKVILTTSSGSQTFATTSSFGLYSFTSVPGGADYTISVSSKRYRFTPRVLTPTANATDIDFVGLE